MKTYNMSISNGLLLLAGSFMVLMSVRGHAEPVLYAIDVETPFLSVVNPITGAEELVIQITLAGENIQDGGNGLAVSPVTNEMFAAVKLSGQNGPGRNLLKINPETGVATNIGNMAQPIAGMAFDSNGILYAVSGDCSNNCGGAAIGETLFTVNTSNASLTLFQTLGNGNGGEAIAFNPNDGMMYHMSGNGVDLIFEKINLSNGVITPIPMSGSPIVGDRETIGFTFDPGQNLFVGSLIDWFTCSCEGVYFTLSANGFLTDVSLLEATWKDFAFYEVITDSDGDGIPDDEDAFPNDASEWLDTDSDGIGNNEDQDDDNDGIPDNEDEYPLGRFNDVAPGYWAVTFIEKLADSGITAGCGNDNYCPKGPVTRGQMAVFLERGMKGSNYSPPAPSGIVFDDVAVIYWAAGFIEQFFLDGITSGCGNNNYCPDAEVTRAQMAVFLLRAKHGAGYLPPGASGVFNDVPLNHWAVHWIEQLAAEGITSGCGNDNYCPDGTVTRDQMAVFLVRTFGL